MSSYISTKELRENFSKVKSAMEAGETLTLLYRSSPLAEIKPLKTTKLKKKKELTIEEKRAKLMKLAGGFKLKNVSLKEMSRQYEKDTYGKVLP